MGSWAYYLEPSYYDRDVSVWCPTCDEEFDVEASIRESTSVAYWQCPKCKNYNETDVD